MIPSVFSSMQYFDEPLFDHLRAAEQEGQLCVDVFDAGEDLRVVATMAGVTASDVHIDIHNDVLTIRGKRLHPEFAQGTSLVRECHWGSFSRSIVLPVSVQVDAIDAQLTDGVLKITLPKVKQQKEIRITVT